MAAPEEKAGKPDHEMGRMDSAAVAASVAADVAQSAVDGALTNAGKAGAAALAVPGAAVATAASFAAPGPETMDRVNVRVEPSGGTGGAPSGAELTTVESVVSEGDTVRMKTFHHYKGDADEESEHVPEVTFEELGSSLPFIGLLTVEVVSATGVLEQEGWVTPKAHVHIDQDQAVPFVSHVKKPEPAEGQSPAFSARQTLRDLTTQKTPTFAFSHEATGDGPPAPARARFVVVTSSAALTVAFKKKKSAAQAACVTGCRNCADSLGNCGTLLKIMCAPCTWPCQGAGATKSSTLAQASLPLADIQPGPVREVTLDVFNKGRVKEDSDGAIMSVYSRNSGIETAGDSGALGGEAGAGASSTLDPPNHNKGRFKMGTVTLKIAYEHLRGTSDGGDFNGPDVMVVMGRRRNHVNRPLRSLHEDNHWLCSHNNIFIAGDTDNPPTITGRFEYGPHRLRGEKVYLFLKDHASHKSFRYVGSAVTDQAGMISFPLPAIGNQPNHYAVRAVVGADNTIGHGSMFVVERRTPVVILDLDGTINIGDDQMVGQMVYNSVGMARAFDARQRPNALGFVRYYAAMGYLPVYLSGRQGSFYNLTYEWLAKHGYPPGPAVLTESHMAALPGKATVGGYKFVEPFKIEYLQGLSAKGLELFAAYGNTGTDIGAYGKGGVPVERTYIIGKDGGKKGTVKVSDWTSHLNSLVDGDLRLPPADPPCKWTALTF